MTKIYKVCGVLALLVLSDQHSKTQEKRATKAPSQTSSDWPEPAELTQEGNRDV